MLRPAKVASPDPNAFLPLAALRNAHTQTLWGPLLRRAKSLPLRHEAYPTPDGDQLSAYRLEGEPGHPTVFVLHGLEGSVESHSVQGLLGRLAALRWNAVVMEYRSCGGRENAAPRLYHSGETEDARFILGEVKRRAQGGPMLLVGFSMGANIAAKFLGEEGSGAPVQGAAVMGAPFDLSAAAQAIDSTMGGIYAWHFLRTLRPKALRFAERHRGIVDAERIRRARSIWEYDDAVTAPVHGFAGAEDYYERSSCRQFLPAIRVPTLLLSAQDDPMIPGRTLPFGEGNPVLAKCFPYHGGHLGFLERPGVYWGERVLVEWLQALVS